MGEQKTALIIFLILFSLLLTFSQIGEVKAIGTVYIRNDGSTEGVGLKLEGGVYVFTGDIYGQIVIEKDGVIVDGSGYVLHGMNEGGIFLENRNDVVLRDIEFIAAPFGVSLLNANSNEVTNSNCSIFLTDSFNNTINDNKRIDLVFRNSSSNTVAGNNITNPFGNGFELRSNSNNNIILRNYITSNLYAGIHLDTTYYNSIYENNIVHNPDGLVFKNCTNNTIYDNIIAYNTNSGIFFRGSSYNKFIKNDIVDNYSQVISMYGSNIWDNGSIGNYWNNYNGTDINNDGIGDEPHYILTFQILTGEDYDIDNYPLVEPIIIPELPSWLILPLLIVSTLVGVIIRNKIRKKGLP